MIYIRTCAYNAEKTLERTILSVLNQTYTDFKYYILDHGSTDRTGDIIRRYAAKDSRIVPYFNKVNRDFTENPEFWWISHNIPEGDYFCILDADDYYAPAFFEEMLAFVRKENLDMAACGTVFFEENTDKIVGGRVLEQNVVLHAPEDWDRHFSSIHWNLRQVWGKLYSSEAAAARYEIELPDWWPHAYGGDTVNVLSCARKVRNFGVYAKPLHFYQLSRRSVSYKWIEGRVESDTLLDEKAREALTELSGTISEENDAFLSVVYCNAVKDTLDVINGCALPPEEKMKQCRKAVDYPLIQRIFKEPVNQYTARCLRNLLNVVLSAGALTGCEKNTDFREITELVFPKCGKAIDSSNVKLFCSDTELQNAVISDDDEALVKCVLSMIKKNSCTKQYDLIGMLGKLTVNEPLLEQFKGGSFLRKYDEIYLMVFRKEYSSALSTMTELLEKNKVTNGTEDYLKLYISLAGQLEEREMFLNGKLRMAKLYLKQKRFDDCRALVKELEGTEMKAHKETDEIKKALGDGK